MITSLTLVDNDRGLSSAIVPRDGIALQGLAIDLSVREVSDNRVYNHGTDDNTEFLGSAAVTLTLRLTKTTRALIDEIAAFMVPGVRPYLVVTDSEWDESRQIRLRADAYSKPLEVGKGLTRDVACQWKAPDGVMTSVMDTVVDINASPVVPMDGLEIWPVPNILTISQYGLVLMPAYPQSGQLLVNNGTLNASWRAKLYGPCTGPKLTNDTTGEAIIFTDSLSLGAGEYVEIDSQDRTAFFLSDPDSSRLAYLDFVNTDWFTLAPGANAIRYNPTVAYPGTAAEVSYPDIWIP